MDGSIVDIHGEATAQPGGVSEVHEGRGIESGENGWKGGSLGRAVVKIDEIGGELVEGEIDLSVAEEGFDPLADQRRKTKVGEDVNSTLDVDIVKESLYVKQDNGGDEFGLNTSVNCVHQ